MKTHQIFKVVTFFLFISNLNAQLNLPLKFSSDAVKWTELSWMDGLKKDDQIIQNLIHPIIVDDTIYSFTNYYSSVFVNNKNYGYCGYIIKKMNKNNGELYWEIQRYYKEYLNRKMLSHPRLFNGNLEISIYDEAPSIGLGTIWYDCYPAHVVIDRQRGIVKDSNYVDKTNSNLVKLYSFGSFTNSSDTRSEIIKNQSGYLHRRSWVGVFLDTHTDFNGNTIRIDTIPYPKYTYAVEQMKFKQMDNDSLWVVMLNRSSKWANKEFLFAKYDSDMNLVKTYDLSQHFQDTITAAGALIDKSGNILIETQFVDDVLQTWSFTYYLFNREGELIDKLANTLRPGIDDTIVYVRLWSMVDKVNNRIILTESRQEALNKSTYFSLYVSDRDTIKRLNKIEVVGIKDHFTSRYATMMDNGDILIYIEQFNDPGASGLRWFSWVMLDGAKMNVISSTKEEVVAQRRLILYPNPATDHITLSGLTHTSQIHIYATDGRHISIPIINKDDQIDVSQLTSGLYFLRVSDGARVINYKFMKQ